jgi:hypothetical protein
MGILYLILGFFDGVSSFSSLEMSSVRSTNSLLAMEDDLMAEDDSSVGSFLWMVAGTSSFGMRGVRVGVGEGFSVDLGAGFLE